LKIKWHLRPWTRLLKWGRDLNIALKYVLQNHLEAIGEIPYQVRRAIKTPLRCRLTRRLSLGPGARKIALRNAINKRKWSAT
ncbi:MAG: hypothetical protein AABZ31_11025, partial [Bdellovibrionota bacterium]